MNTMNFRKMTQEDLFAYGGIEENDANIADVKINFNSIEVEATIILDEEGIYLLILENDFEVSEYYFATGYSKAIVTMFNWEANFNEEILGTLGFKRIN